MSPQHHYTKSVCVRVCVRVCVPAIPGPTNRGAILSKFPNTHLSTLNMFMSILGTTLKIEQGIH